MKVGTRLGMKLLAMVLIAAQLVWILPPQAPALASASGSDEWASKPYMGWSSYSLQVYHDGQWITAENIKAQSDAMHEKLQPFGYNYINVDAGWNGSMDEYGRPVPSTELYPDGLQDVIDHVHANGQKFGLYFIPGLSPQAYEDNLQIYGTSCRMQDIAEQPLRQADYWGLGYKIDFSKPCAQKYIDSIADMLGEWGVDFVKFDSVTPGSGISDLSLDARDDVKAWSQALKRHNIWLELSWALDIRYADYWKEYADGWRIDWDIECYCNSEALTTWSSIARLFPKAEQWWRHAGQEGWNDFDSLNVGNGEMDGLSEDERQTAMTFWSISAAPLYIGDDMTKLDDFGIQLLTNEEVIEVNQAGRPARPVSTETDQQVWYANHGDGTYTVGLFNLGEETAKVAVDWSMIGLEGSAAIRDLWSRTDLGVHMDGFSSELPAHGSRLLRVTAQKGKWTAVNDDDTGIRYTGTWDRNGGHELPADSQNVIIEVVDDQAAGSKISPVSASFDKRSSMQSDVEVDIAWNDNRALVSIANGDHTLAPNKDYTLSGSTVSIHAAYLAEQPIGTASLVFTFPKGMKQRLVISIQDSTVQDSQVYPPVVRYDRSDDRQPSLQEDIRLSVAWRGNELQAATHDTEVLEQGRDYDVSGNTIQLNKDYLNTLPAGMTDLRFDFSGGQEQYVALIVRDPAHGSTLVLNDDNPDIRYSEAWNRSDNRGLGDYRDDVHFAEKDGEYFEYTFTGTGVELVTELDPSQGEIDIYVDDVLVRTVNTHNEGRLAQQTIFHQSGLDYGTHTIRAVKKSGVFMLLDQINVLMPNLISPAAVEYDRSDSAAGDVILTAELDNQHPKHIVHGETELVAGQDYTLEGDRIVLHRHSLQSLPLGLTSLRLIADGGASQTLVVKVEDPTATNSRLLSEEAEFDKYELRRQDVAVAVEWSGNTLESIDDRGKPLASGTDYTVNADGLVISRDYLKDLPLGRVPLTLHFSEGAPQVLYVEVRDTTPVRSTIQPPVLTFDQHPDVQDILTVTMQVGGNPLTSITYRDKMLTPGEDYIVSGNQVAFLIPFLSQLPLGTAEIEFGFDAGQSSRLSIVVIDSARGRYVSINDDDPRIAYTGSWQHNRERKLGNYRDDVHFTERDGDFYEFRFRGTGIEIMTEKDPAHGDMDIYIDGVYHQTISTYAPEKLVQETVYHIAGLSDEEHVLKVVKKSGYYMLLDRLKYRVQDVLEPDIGVFRKGDQRQKDIEIGLKIDRSNLLAIRNKSEFLKQGRDYTVSGNRVKLKKNYMADQQAGHLLLSFQFKGDYLDDLHATRQNGDFFEYRFNGTGVELLMPKGPTQGKVDVYLDGKLMKTIDAYHSSRQTVQSVFRITGLQPGEHTVKAVKRSGDWMLADQLKYQVGQEKE